MIFRSRNLLNIIKRRLTTSHPIKAILILFLFYYIVATIRSRNHENKLKVLPNVVLHLDLKGAFPKIKYLQNLIMYFKLFGVTALLVEYDDRFPYHGSLETLSSRNCYKWSELKSLISFAELIEIDIIPFVPTFGHMEFVLKNRMFAYMRENSTSDESLCPTQQRSKDLIRTMLEQIIEFHSQKYPLKYLHIGCGDVMHLNECKFCKKTGLSKSTLFANHIKEVYNIVQTLSPDTKILIWDNSLRRSHPERLENLKIPIQPVAWDFKPEITFDKTDLSNYYNDYGKIWIATAYKGVDKDRSLFPKLENRIQNHYEWLKRIQQYRTYPSPTDFEGIILTGWSRFTHKSAHQEILPTAIPSIVTNLQLIKMFQSNPDLDMKQDWKKFYLTHLEENIKKNLSCDFKHDMFTNNFPVRCSYMGSNIVQELTKFKLFEESLVKQKAVIFNFSLNKSELVDEFNELSFQLQQLKLELRLKMLEWYSDAAAKIYIDEKSEDYNKILELLETLMHLESVLTH